MKKKFCCPALELFLLPTPTFLLSTPMDNSEATQKKATKCNKGKIILSILSVNVIKLAPNCSQSFANRCESMSLILDDAKLQHGLINGSERELFNPVCITPCYPHLLMQCSGFCQSLLYISPAVGYLSLCNYVKHAQGSNV